MNHLMSVTMAAAVMISTLVPLHSGAWSPFSIDERIELGNQGYASAEVEGMCRDAGQTKRFGSMLRRELANELTQEPSSGFTTTVGGSETDSHATSSPNGARFCGTSYGTCPLLGGPTGSACHCPGWNGYLFTGVSR